MMFRTRFLFVLLCLAVISLGPAAYAQDYTTWTGPGDAVWDWEVINGICTLKIGVYEDFGIDTMDDFDIGGPAPAEDPIVEQYVRNRTTGYWSDWHVVIENGFIMEGTTPIVYNESATTPPWLVSVNTERTGFDAIVVPSSGTQVDVGERLYVYFVFRPAVFGEPGYGLPVKVTQSPTNTAPIPEPASLIALLSGLAAFGLQLRRRS